MSIDGQIYEESEVIRYDEQFDVPMVLYEGEYYYNPVTIAQNGLGWYNQYLNTGEQNDIEKFISTADFFITHIQDDGSFPYTIPFALKTNMVLPEGFISGMAQGQILSVLIRAWDITQDEKYLKAGNKVLGFALNCVDENIFDGSRKELRDFTNLSDELEKFSDLRLIEEYVTSPSSFVLNGDMIGALGLRDWGGG